jgi:hypothetical protein
MRFISESFGERFHDARNEFIERMQRFYFRYNIDIPGVLTSVASIFMVGLALTFVFQARGG